MRLLIAGGGTGGHIFPALAVTDALRRRPDPPDLRWVGGHRGFEADIVRRAGLPFRRLILRTLRTVDRDVHLIADPLRLVASVPQAIWLLARQRPAAILSTGGYLAIPVLIAAAVLRIPSVLWEGNVVPGRSTRLVARFASVVAVSFPGTAAGLGDRPGHPVVVTGTPIRDVGAIDRHAARERLGIEPTDRVVLVFGGSQAVRRLNDAVAAVLPELVARAVVIHVTGDAGLVEAVAGRSRLPAGLGGRYRPSAFLGDDMLPSLAAADLVIGRAGSSTLAESAAFGLPIVVVPYPHAAGHQRANAEALAATGAAIIVEDDAFDGAALLAATELLADPVRHAMMAAAAREAGRPGAADAVADLLLALVTRSPIPSMADLEHRSRARAGHPTP